MIKTEHLPSTDYRTGSFKLAIKQTRIGGDETTATVRRVLLSNGTDQLQLEFATLKRGEKRNRTEYAALILEPPFIGDFIKACQQRWEP